MPTAQTHLAQGLALVQCVPEPASPAAPAGAAQQVVIDQVLQHPQETSELPGLSRHLLDTCAVLLNKP